MPPLGICRYGKRFETEVGRQSSTRRVSSSEENRATRKIPVPLVSRCHAAPPTRRRHAGAVAAPARGVRDARDVVPGFAGQTPFAASEASGPQSVRRECACGPRRARRPGGDVTNSRFRNARSSREGFRPAHGDGTRRERGQRRTCARPTFTAKVPFCRWWPRCRPRLEVSSACALECGNRDRAIANTLAARGFTSENCT